MCVAYRIDDDGRENRASDRFPILGVLRTAHHAMVAHLREGFPTLAFIVFLIDGCERASPARERDIR